MNLFIFLQFNLFHISEISLVYLYHTSGIHSAYTIDTLLIHSAYTKDVFWYVFLFGIFFYNCFIFNLLASFLRKNGNNYGFWRFLHLLVYFMKMNAREFVFGTIYKSPFETWLPLCHY